ncbi:hypothetical protein GCM10022393_33050 [Aquimarina addita]|uniref:FAD-binding oxidoreductase n=1 Tax=Aquimarina addita TaxID=870485 RepID=A0ABP6UP81_9FLAO
MTLSIWRYSHLALAIVSSAFLLIASVTGIILAFDPIANSIESYAIDDIEEVTLAKTIHVLQERYDELITLEIDEHDAIIATVVTKEGNSETIYVDPLTGKKLGVPVEKSDIIKFATNLHRSLFLKGIGRFFVGFVSFLLLLLSITGTLLILKRQGNVKRFFSKIRKKYFTQYSHIILGRLLLIPIFIIAITGVYLSLEKFSLLPAKVISHTIHTNHSSATRRVLPKDFELFKTIFLTDMRSVEFPFSDAPEDYFIVKLSNRELIIDQYTGTIISEEYYPLITLASYWSLALHTGKGSAVWSVVLLISCCSILFFIYSGFSMTIRRIKKSSISNFNHNKDEAEYIILVGSETGSTFAFATIFANALSALGKTVFISELNNYCRYKRAKHLIIFTATYGQGEPPTNAKRFEKNVKAIQPINQLQFSVVGFGSLAYPDFCKYALDLDTLLKMNPKFESILEPCKINNQSFTTFKEWAMGWSSQMGLDLYITPPEKEKVDKVTFSVIDRSDINEDDTFLLHLKPHNNMDYESGDLLAFYPKEDNVRRLYSIGKVNGNIMLSIKKHEFGICSTFFSQLEKGDKIKAVIQQNTTFHFPANKKDVIFIANGTGIAPFLGMITSYPLGDSRVHLFWGGRNTSSVLLYNEYIKKAQETKHLSTVKIIYSQELGNKMYVQDQIEKEASFIASVLKNGGVIMICGSIAMQKEVIKVLEKITATYLSEPLQTFKQQKQIKIDCY